MRPASAVLVDGLGTARKEQVTFDRRQFQYVRRRLIGVAR
jgi:hypothetical protein